MLSVWKHILLSFFMYRVMVLLGILLTSHNAAAIQYWKLYV
jgi:hypothetical protein